MHDRESVHGRASETLDASLHPLERDRECWNHCGVVGELVLAGNGAIPSCRCGWRKSEQQI